MIDAIVIGAGPNGLVAANVLADEGWDVTVFEARAEPGGAVRSGPLTRPGFVHDRFSSFYPLAVASPVMRDLHLEDTGLRWLRAPLALAHPRPDGSCAVLSTDVDETAASLDSFASGDGDGWRRLFARWQRASPRLLDALFTPFPPVVPAARLALAVGARGLLDLARLAVLPVRRMAEEEFAGAGGGLLLAGAALHADLAPESPGSALFGCLLCFLGQQVGFPVPEGGAGGLTAALVRRLESRGGRVVCNAPVERVLVRDGRAVGVAVVGGTEVEARRAVVADVSAPALYRELVAPEHLPARLLDDVRRFQWDHATVKVDWALDGPIPWEAKDARRAGTVHVADSIDDLTDVAAQLAKGWLPDRPYLILGQYSMVDPSRAPERAETVWAYTRVPQRVRGDAGGELTGSWDQRETDAFVQRMEERIEALAPGFRSLVIGRHVATPATLEAADANLVGGAVGGGTAQLHQQLVFRPVPGTGRAETPVRGLFLASASAHPGGGVHGGPGANAARAALARARRGKVLAGAGLSAGAVLAARRARSPRRR